MSKRLLSFMAAAVLFAAALFVIRHSPSRQTVGAASAPTRVPNGATSSARDATTSSRERDAAVNPYAAALREPGRSKRPWDAGFIRMFRNARSGDPIRFELTGGMMAEGAIRVRQFRDGELTYLSGELTSPEVGKFFILTPPPGGKAGKAAGVIEFWGSKTAYRIEPTGASGEPELWQRRLDEVLCLAMPLAAPTAGEMTNNTANIPPLRPDQVPDYAPGYNTNIVSLQSYPGSPAVLLLDFFGGYTPTWGGVSYPRPNVSNAQIKDVWKRVAEDYMPFNINVTTDTNVYKNAPISSRQKCVFTSSTSAVPAGAAGISYVGSWNWGSDTVCWSTYTTGKNGGEVGSHEPGHTLGLGHQGTSTQGYYGGQGSGVTGWTPLMGVGFYQGVSTWARGEYLDANNTEDELYVITTWYNNVAYRPDDTGSTLATSRYLEVYSDYSAFAEGVIERTNDTDAFQFTTSGGAVSLTATPVGDWADLAVMATLASATDTIIASNNPQAVLSATISTSLAAGTYTFRVTAAGRNSPLTNGFSAYCSHGYYSVTGSVAGARQPTRLSVYERAASGTVVGAVPALNNTNGSPLGFVIVSGNSNATFSIDAGGVVRVANNTLLDYARLATNTMLAVKFDLLVNITNQLSPALTELNRRVVIAVLNANDPPVVTGFTNSILAGTQRGFTAGTVTFSSTDPQETLSLSIVGGNPNSAFAISQGGTVTVAGDLSASVQSNYVLTVTASDNAYPVSLVGTGYVNITVMPNATPFQPGSISYALYDNIGSSQLISGLTGNARFPRDPTSERQMPTMEGESDRADNYGSVMRGYLIPPQSGSYTFWIAADDNGELWMSTTTNPASMTLVASISGSGNWAPARQWTKYTTQQSAARSLVAGQGYYIEARHKESSSGDNLAVAWKGPATANLTNVIPGQYLAPYSMNYVPHATGFTTTLRQDVLAGTPAGTVVVADINAGDDHSFAITGGDSAGLFWIDAAGTVHVADAAALAASLPASYTLQVSVTDNGTPPLATNTTASISVVTPGVSITAGVRREIFNGIGGGTAVSDLTNSAPYPGRPDALEILGSFACVQNIGDSYGSRVRALLTPTNDGTYTFFIASDDSSLLLLSPDSSAANAVRIAYVSGYSGYNTWATYASQVSTGITLVAGQSYYIEALQKDGSGGDHLSVAWSGPGIVSANGAASTNIIAGSFLSAVDINYPPKFTNQTLRVFNTVASGTLIGKAVAEDSPLDRLTYALVDGNTNGMFALAPDTGGLTVIDNTLIASGAMTSFPLTVAVQDSGCGGLYPLKSAQAVVTVSVSGTNGEFTWTGGADTGNWSSPNNWGGAAPGAGARLTFGMPSQQANINDQVSSVATITLNASGFNLSGQPLTVQSGMANSGSNAWSLNTTLGAAQTWLSSGGTLTLNGALTNSGFLLALVANGDIQVNGPISGAGGLAKSGTARLLMQGVHTYSGPTTVSSAGSSSTALLLSGPADLFLTNSDLTMNGRMDLSNHNATIGALNGSGTLFANDIPRPLLTIGVNGHSGSFSGVLQDNTAGLGITLAIAKTGGGIQAFSGASTFTGGTFIRAGQVTLANAAALGAGPVTLGDAATGTNAVSLLASAAATYANSLVISAQAAGPVTIGTTNISPGAANAQFSGKLTLNRDVTLQAGSTNRTTFAGQVTGIGNVLVTSPYAAGRRVVFDRPSGGANDFAGSIVVSSNAWLQIGATNSIGNRCIPDTAAVSFYPGAQLRFAPTGSGDTETVDALSSLSPGAGTVDMISGSTFTLVLGGNNGSGWFGGSLANSAGSLALVKIGTGTQTLAGASTCTGPTAILGGTLAFGPAGSAASSPTLDVKAGAVLDGTALTAGLTIPAAQTLTGNGAVLGNVLVNGTLAPGPSAGGLSFSNNLALAGVARLEIHKTGTTLANGFATVAGTLTFGGALVVTNTGETLAPGDSFPLFPAAAYRGSFASLVLPALPASMHWDLARLPVNGTLRVATTTPPQLAAGLSSGGTFQLQFPSEYGVDYVLQTATSLVTPISWVNVSTNAGTGAPLALAPPADPDQVQAFYRVIVYY